MIMSPAFADFIVALARVPTAGAVGYWDNVGLADWLSNPFRVARLRVVAPITEAS